MVTRDDLGSFLLLPAGRAAGEHCRREGARQDLKVGYIMGAGDDIPRC